jgi:hypothetical protein
MLDELTLLAEKMIMADYLLPDALKHTGMRSIAARFTVALCWIVKVPPSRH